MNSSLQKWLKRALIGGPIVGLVGVIALQALRSVAFSRGVTLEALPPGSEVQRMAVGADYTDAYSVPVDDEMTIESLAFGAGKEIARTANEIVFEGRAPGLRFLAAYHLDPGRPRTLTLSTAVFYESWIGRAYFLPVGFVHRRIVPFGLSGRASVE